MDDALMGQSVIFEVSQGYERFYYEARLGSEIWSNFWAGFLRIITQTNGQDRELDVSRM